MPKAEINTAKNGNEALDMLEKTEYDLIFLDYNMPGLSDWEFTRFKKSGKIYACVIVYANDLKMKLKELFDAGAVKLLPKALNQKTL